MGARSSRQIIEDIASDAIEEWGTETIGEALDKAEQAEAAKTPLDEQNRCPECLTVRIYKKQEKYRVDHKINTAYRCTNRHHFDKPRPPLAEFPVEQALKWLDRQHHYRTIHRDTMPINTPFNWLSRTDLEENTERRPLLSTLDDEQLTELAIRLYRPWTGGGPSYREIAAALPYSRQWIGERVREWKRGEHRDLVEQPGPTADATGVEPIAADGGTLPSRWAAYGSD